MAAVSADSNSPYFDSSSGASHDDWNASVDAVVDNVDIAVDGVVEDAAAPYSDGETGADAWDVLNAHDETAWVGGGERIVSCRRGSEVDGGRV